VGHSCSSLDEEVQSKDERDGQAAKTLCYKKAGMISFELCGLFQERVFEKRTQNIEQTGFTVMDLICPVQHTRRPKADLKTASRCDKPAATTEENAKTLIG
jgi:hypothetical protein